MDTSFRLAITSNGVKGRDLGAGLCDLALSLSISPVNTESGLLVLRKNPIGIEVGGSGTYLVSSYHSSLRANWRYSSSRSSSSARSFLASSMSLRIMSSMTRGFVGETDELDGELIYL